MIRLLAILALASTAVAGEYAVLASGSRLRVDRHEQSGGKLILYLGAGSLTLDAPDVRAFEPEDYIPLQPAAVAGTPLPPAALDPKTLVDAAARNSAIPQKLLRSVVAAESAYRPDAVSPKGALGLMQLMPATASTYGADPKDPAQNVAAGTAYLRDLLLKYEGDVPKALAAYNAGPGAVAKYQGVPPYRETNAYVSRVIRNWLNTPKPFTPSPSANTAGQSSPPE
jgi:hypothetical protein